MARNDVKITVELEPIVHVVCINTECKYNLIHIPAMDSCHCALKYLEIGRDGKCTMAVKKE